MSRLPSRGITGKIAIRIKRPWRGWKAGAVINPPAALRTQLLRQKDQLGNRVAELAVPVSVQQPEKSQGRDGKAGKKAKAAAK